MMATIVCSLDHRCYECPGKAKLVKFLLQCHFQIEDLDSTEELSQEIIQFPQWQSIDRTQINNLSLPLNDFIEFAADKIDQLTAHFFIAKCQSAYLKSRKENLSPN